MAAEAAGDGSFSVARLAGAGAARARRIGCDTMDIEGMPLALLVNPSSAGGKTLRLLPRVEAALDARRTVFRVQRTKGLEHGVEQALLADRSRRAAGGDVRRRSGRRRRRCHGRRRDAARHRPRRPRQRPRPGAGDPRASPRRRSPPSSPATARRIDVGEVNGKRFLGIASVGFDSEANRRANESRLLRGNLVYAYAALRTLVGWKPARFTIRVDDERIRLSGYSIAVANSKAYGGGMYVAPDAELDDGQFDIVAIGEVGKLRFVGNLPKVFKGTHVEADEVQRLPRPAPRAERQQARSRSTPTAST